MSKKGYKVFNPDWTCRDFQYEVGKTFVHTGEIGICEAGFHFCEKISNCFNYYNFDSENKVAEIEATGNIMTDGEKSVTDEIKIVREISWHEVLNLANTGKNCTGYNNTGDCNTGDCNTGGWNTGDWNTGDCNTGNWNSCDFSTGFFNSVSQPIYAFNKPLDIDRETFLSCDGIRALNCNFSNNIWICSEDMTAEEKKSHPEHECTGGYLESLDFKDACRLMWDKLSDDEKKAVCEIPNFDPDVFEEITGIDVKKG